MGRASQLTVWENVTKTVPKCRTAVSHTRAYGVWRRGSIYQFRIRVPNDLHAIIGRTHLSRSLKTDSLTLANRLAARCALEAAATFDRARQTPPTAMLGEIERAATAASPRTVSVTFDELRNRYLGDPTSSRTIKSLHAYRSSLSMLVEIVGGDKPVSHIDRALCRDVMNVLAACRWIEVPQAINLPDPEGALGYWALAA